MAADLHALAGAYALDAVDDLERAAFTRHLTDCESCSLEVAELRETAARLGGSVIETPPATLRTAVLADIRGTRQAPPMLRTVTATRPVERGQRWIAMAVAASLLVVAGAVGSWTLSEQRARQQQDRIEALQDENARMYAVFNAPDVTMRGSDVPIGGRIAAAVSPQLNAGVAMLAGLPELPADQVFQLWLLKGSDAYSAAVLAKGQRGGTLLFGWRAGSDTFGISVEPGPTGSAKPTVLLSMFPLT
jgi:anti-sigma factor RsiW